MTGANGPEARDLVAPHRKALEKFVKLDPVRLNGTRGLVGAVGPIAVDIANIVLEGNHRTSLPGLRQIREHNLTALRGDTLELSAADGQTTLRLSGGDRLQIMSQDDNGKALVVNLPVGQELVSGDLRHLGQQMRASDFRNGTKILTPLKDPKNIEARRAFLGVVQDAVSGILNGQFNPPVQS